MSYTIAISMLNLTDISNFLYIIYFIYTLGYDGDYT